MKCDINVEKIMANNGIKKHLTRSHQAIIIAFASLAGAEKTDKSQRMNEKAQHVTKARY